MNRKEFDHKEFRVHLNKVIGYLEEMTHSLEKALDSYLLVEKEQKKRVKKPTRNSKRP